MSRSSHPLFIAALLLGAATTPSLAESRTYDVPAFDEASITSALNAEIVVGDVQSITVEAVSSSVLETLRVAVVDGRLNVWRERAFWDFLTVDVQAIKLKITVPQLTRLDVSAASVVGASGMTGDRVEVNVSSASRVAVSGLVAGTAALSASSAGTLVIGGSCDSSTVQLSSAGTIHGGAFECVDLQVDASSAGRGLLYASGNVTGTASSGSHVELVGDPDHVDDETSSGGDIDVVRQ